MAPVDVVHVEAVEPNVASAHLRSPPSPAPLVPEYPRRDGRARSAWCRHLRSPSPRPHPPHASPPDSRLRLSARQVQAASSLLADRARSSGSPSARNAAAPPSPAPAPHPAHLRPPLAPPTHPS